MYSNCVDSHNYFLSKLYSLKNYMPLKIKLATQLLLKLQLATIKESQLILDKQESGESKLFKEQQKWPHDL